MKHWSIVLVILCALGTGACRSLPPSVPGPEAEALAERMLAAINLKAWNEQTAAAEWAFRGKRRTLWDRKRQLIQVTWDQNDVRFDKRSMKGIVRQAGKVVSDPGLQAQLLAEANKIFVNDAFWLNPLFHIRSPGAQLSLVAPGVLKVHYPTGGTTPGDSYVLETNKEGLVTQMRLWVSSVPIKGAAATFENYEVSETGVKSARRYGYLVGIEIQDLKMFAQFPPAGERDPFAELASEQGKTVSGN